MRCVTCVALGGGAGGGIGPFAAGVWSNETSDMVSENPRFRRPMPIRRRWKAVTRKLRELGSIGSALLDTGHPYMAHIVPMRRCNLACTYCNEFDEIRKAS